MALRLETIPDSTRHMRSCILCSLVKTFNQFVKDGCDNCDQVLGMKGDDDKVSARAHSKHAVPYAHAQVQQCTSTNFDGALALMKPQDSWVAKWQNVQRKVPGMYAVSVSGALPPDVEVCCILYTSILYLRILYLCILYLRNAGRATCNGHHISTGTA